MVIKMYLQGKDLDTPDIRNIRAEWKFPAMIMSQRWIDIFHETDDIYPTQATRDRYSVYTVANLMKRDLYWSEPPPIEMAGVETRDMIDLDKAGFKLEDQSRLFGKCIAALRVDQRGFICAGGNIQSSLPSQGTRT